MQNPLPQFVNQVLVEWDFIAFFAYDNFESVGRGVVGLMEGEESVQTMYGTRDYFCKQEDDQQVLLMLDAYNPETEFLVHFDATSGTRTIRIKTPEGGRNPKRIWFFEMLWRVSETPEELPDRLPNWFSQACERLERMQNDKAK